VNKGIGCRNPSCCVTIVSGGLSTFSSNFPHLVIFFLFTCRQLIFFNFIAETALGADPYFGCALPVAVALFDKLRAHRLPADCRQLFFCLPAGAELPPLQNRHPGNARIGTLAYGLPPHRPAVGDPAGHHKDPFPGAVGPKKGPRAPGLHVLTGSGTWVVSRTSTRRYSGCTSPATRLARLRLAAG
jgi:hypothetical protein